MGKLYQEILDEMEHKIATSEWPVGYKLPREVDMCKQLHVSRTTLRRALSVLVQKGRIKRVKGTGTFVSEPKIIERSTLFMDSFAEEMQEHGQTVVSQVLEFHPMQADSRLAAYLGIRENDQIVKLTRLRYAADCFEKGPVMLTTSYFLNHVGQMLMKYDMEKKSVRRICRENGIIRGHMIKHISAVNLPPLKCRMLGSPDDAIFLFISSEVYDRDSRCIEYVESYYPVDRNEFTITTVSHIATE